MGGRKKKNLNKKQAKTFQRGQEETEGTVISHKSAKMKVSMCVILLRVRLLNSKATGEPGNVSSKNGCQKKTKKLKTQNVSYPFKKLGKERKDTEEKDN